MALSLTGSYLLWINNALWPLKNALAGPACGEGVVCPRLSQSRVAPTDFGATLFPYCTGQRDMVRTGHRTSEKIRVHPRDLYIPKRMVIPHKPKSPLLRK